MDYLKEIEKLQQEQRQLVFESFDEEDAWKIGCMLRQRAKDGGFPVAISITLNRRRMFACTMPGTTPINDNWIRRKENTVYQFYKSSYEMSLYMQLKEDEISSRYGLDRESYAAAGGCVPIMLKSTGMVGTIAVSGLREDEDHSLVTGVIRDYLKEMEDTTNEN